MSELVDALRTAGGAADDAARERARPVGGPDLGHALVTGGGSGIGAAIARRLSADGYRVSLVGRRADRLAEVAESLAAPGHVAPADVVDQGALDSAIAGAAAANGPVRVLVAAAGIAESRPFLKTDAAFLERLMAVNVTGVLNACRSVLPGMLAAGDGRIVAVASTAALKGYAYVSAYAASKHAVLGMVRSLALEVARKGVTVNAVCPGFADTEMTAETIGRIRAETGRSEAEARAALTDTNPMRRLVSPDEVADAVAWLAGPGAAAVTGQAIAVACGEVTA